MRGFRVRDGDFGVRMYSAEVQGREGDEVGGFFLSTFALEIDAVELVGGNPSERTPRPMRRRADTERSLWIADFEGLLVEK